MHHNTKKVFKFKAENTKAYKVLISKIGFGSMFCTEEIRYILMHLFQIFLHVLSFHEVGNGKCISSIKTLKSFTRHT